jgi:hypothetical protein
MAVANVPTHVQKSLNDIIAAAQAFASVDIVLWDWIVCCCGQLTCRSRRRSWLTLVLGADF